MYGNAPLTQENFFDEMQRRFPAGTQMFMDWFGSYRDRVGWHALFNSDSDYQNSQGKNAPVPRFEQLPHAMQMGIYLEFLRQGPNVASPDRELLDINIYGFDLRSHMATYIEKVLEYEAAVTVYCYIKK